MIKKLILDTNCIIDIDEKRANLESVVRLSDASKLGKIEVSVCGISASENQKGGVSLDNFSKFSDRLKKLDLEHLNVLFPMAIWDVTYWDTSISCGPEQQTLFTQIWNAMFPNINANWQLYEKERANQGKEKNAYRDWLNALCDAQIAWATIYYNQDALVTANVRDFQKNAMALGSLGVRNIFTPLEAIKYA